MSRVPSDLSYRKIVNALQRDGWVVVRHQGGSHIQLVKRNPEGRLRLTVPAHRPVKRNIVASILKQARIDLDRFLELL